MSKAVEQIPVNCQDVLERIARKALSAEVQLLALQRIVDIGTLDDLAVNGGYCYVNDCFGFDKGVSNLGDAARIESLFLQDDWDLVLDRARNGLNSAEQIVAGSMLDCAEMLKVIDVLNDAVALRNCLEDNPRVNYICKTRYFQPDYLRRGWARGETIVHSPEYPQNCVNKRALRRLLKIQS